MYLDKTGYQTSLDLTLYIEELFNVYESEVEEGLNIITEESIETIILNDLVTTEVEGRTPKIEQKTEVQVTEIKPPIPAWGQKPFKCLLVESAGMSLMVPAMSVSYIERINKKIIRSPLSVESFRGVLTLRKHTVAVIDLLSLVSENGTGLNKISTQVNTHHIENVIVMDNGSYALACDDIGEMVLLETESVRWNKASFNNPMFAGIVPEYLCPIINIDNIKQQVANIPFVQPSNKNY